MHSKAMVDDVEQNERRPIYRRTVAHRFIQNRIPPRTNSPGELSGLFVNSIVRRCRQALMARYPSCRRWRWRLNCLASPSNQLIKCSETFLALSMMNKGTARPSSSSIQSTPWTCGRHVLEFGRIQSSRPVCGGSQND